MYQVKSKKWDYGERGITYFVLSVVFGIAPSDWAFTLIWVWSKSAQSLRKTVFVFSDSPPVKMNRVNGSFWKIGTAVRVSGPHWGIKTYILLWCGVNAETEESLSKIPVCMLKNIFGGGDSKKLEEVAMGSHVKF